MKQILQVKHAINRFEKRVFSTVFFSMSLLASMNANSQQNLFNIPSGDITPKGKVFYQHQLNVHRKYLESKGHFVYGLGKGWDAGVNLVGKGFFFTREWREMYRDKPNGPEFYPILMGTLQKQFKLSDRIDFNVGVQAGANLSWRLQNKTLNFFSYALNVFHLGKGSRLVGGVYQSNEMFIGTGRTNGLMLGYEFKLSKRFYLMGDWMSGTNDAGAAVLGGMVNVSRRVQLCAGWLRPNSGSPKAGGVVLELNLLGWDLFGKE